MKIVCVKDTHYFFSAGKDKKIKYWDADTYQMISEFDECLGQIWTICLNSVGDILISGS
jgi:U3 small nucleolar RNA-associated protein 12